MTQQRWVPVVAYGGTMLVGGMTIVVSAFWLTHLAALIGSPWPIALPITVDAGGAVATVAWLTGPSKDARAWGRAVAIGALAASIVGNVLAHMIELGMLAVTAALVVGVSAVYPVMCWLMVHLVVLLRTPARMPTPARKPTGKSTGTTKTPTRPVAAPAEAAAAPAEPEPGTVPLHVVEQPTGSKREQARAWFDSQVAAGRDPAQIRPAEVDKAIGASGYAKKFIATWRDEATTTAAEAAVNE